MINVKISNLTMYSYVLILDVVGLRNSVSQTA